MATVEQLIISFLLLLLASSGLCVYIMVIRVLMTKFSKKSYYVLAGWLGVADCICLLMTIFYVVPSIYMDKLLHNSTVYGALINISWFSGLPIIVLLAVDRYLCICQERIHKKVYTQSKTKIYCILAWVFGIGYSFPSFFKSCEFEYFIEVRSWGWNTDNECSRILSYGEIGMLILVAGAMFIFNGLVIR